LLDAIEHAFSYDTKILIESFIQGKEIACAVLGDYEEMLVSVLGEIRPGHEFYTYEAKYQDPHGATYTIPAKLSSNLTSQIQEAAKTTFKALEAYRIGRVDFFCY